MHFIPQKGWNRLVGKWLDPHKKVGLKFFPKRNGKDWYEVRCSNTLENVWTEPVPERLVVQFSCWCDCLDPPTKNGSSFLFSSLSLSLSLSLAPGEAAGGRLQQLPGAVRRGLCAAGGAGGRVEARDPPAGRFKFAGGKGAAGGFGLGVLFFFFSFPGLPRFLHFFWSSNSGERFTGHLQFVCFFWPVFWWF